MQIRVHSCTPTRAFQVVVDTALESSALALLNAVSTSIYELRSGEWQALNNEPDSTRLSTGRDRVVRDRVEQESAGLSTRPLTTRVS